MALPALAGLDLTGKTLTADALLTQRTIAESLHERGAHYVFTVKVNQANLYDAIQRLFQDRGAPDFQDPPSKAHGRIEQRAIWTSEHLNSYLDFPHVGQVFAIERVRTDPKTGAEKREYAYGITSHTPVTTTPESLLAYNRGHWAIENSCHHILDQTWDEDRRMIRSGYGPENTTALRRFAIGLIKARSRDSVAATTARLARNVRLVLDYLGMTANSKRWVGAT